MMTFLSYVVYGLLALILLYAGVRTVSAAWFKSKREHMHNLHDVWKELRVKHLEDEIADNGARHRDT
jgi:hypothetical protein